MDRILKQDEGVLVTLEDMLVKKTVFGLNYSGLRGRVTPQEMVKREIRALQLLADVPGIQRFVRRESADTFFSEYMAGNSLRTSRSMDAVYFNKLAEIVRQCLCRGVYRLGQNRDDFIVSPEGDPKIIDFGNILFFDDPTAKVLGIVYLVEIYNLTRVWDLQRRYAS